MKGILKLNNNSPLREIITGIEMFLMPPGRKALKSAVKSLNICKTQETCLQITCGRIMMACLLVITDTIDVDLPTVS